MNGHSFKVNSRSESVGSESCAELEESSRNAIFGDGSSIKQLRHRFIADNLNAPRRFQRFVLFLHKFLLLALLELTEESLGHVFQQDMCVLLLSESNEANRYIR